MKKNLGFTAYELAVTIAIISVIAAVTLPPYLKWWRSSRLQSGVSNLTADLEMAKTRAVRENALIVIDFDTASYTIFVDNNKDGNHNTGEDVILYRSLPAGVSIDTDSLTFPTYNDKLRFNGRGIPLEIVSNEEIPVKQSSTNRKIIINRLGNIDVQ